jgi:acyl-CoA thioesterase I
MRRKIWIPALPILLLLSLFGTGSALAQANEILSPAEICLAANSTISLDARLPRTAALLKSGAPIKIVAIGSSSTVGLWVLRSAATYPAVMRQELARLMPKARIDLINSGRIGDTIPDTIARFERDVLVHRADLVVWQLGTNDIAWGGQTDGLAELIMQGLRILRSGGSDVILMDQQYAPRVLSSSQYSKMQAIIADIARREHVGLFSRFNLMRHAIEAGLTMGALVSWDGLHNSAEGYDCIGRALARAIWSTTR